MFFFSEYCLNQAPGIDPYWNRNVNSHLVLSLIVAWIVVFFSLIKGIKSSGKVGFMQRGIHRNSKLILILKNYDD